MWQPLVFFITLWMTVVWCFEWECSSATQAHRFKMVDPGWWTVWEAFGGVALSEEVCHWEWLWSFKSPCQAQFPFLLLHPVEIGVCSYRWISLMILGREPHSNAYLKDSKLHQAKSQWEEKHTEHTVLMDSPRWCFVSDSHKSLWAPWGDYHTVNVPL